MKEIGVSWALRKAGAMASSTTEISQEGDGVRVNTQSTVKSSNFVFPNGKAVDYTTMDGRKTKVRTGEQFLGYLNSIFTIFNFKIYNFQTTLNLNGDEINSEESWDGKTSKINFSVQNGEMVITLTFNGVTCKRFHTKE